MKCWKSHKNDILLILVLLLAAGGIRMYLLLTRSAGGEAVVTVDGTVVASLSLGEDTAFPVAPDSGFDGGTGFHNTVEISDGRVRVIDANCPDKVCERTGWIRYDGEMIVCLPHRLIVTVVGGEAAADVMAQ